MIFTKRDRHTFFNFDGAQFYRKTATIPKTNVRMVTAPKENIGTIINDHLETKNVAVTWDYSVVGIHGEQYVIRSDKFDQLWETDPKDPARYRSKNCGWAVPLTEDTEIEPNWGGIQQVAKDGVAFKSRVTGEVYLIEKIAFEAYSPAVEK